MGSTSGSHVIGDLTFTLGGLSVETTDGKGNATIDLGAGLSIEGDVVIKVAGGGIQVIIKKPSLVFAPDAPNGSALTDGSASVEAIGAKFRVGLTNLPDGGFLSAQFAKDASAFLKNPRAAFELVARRLRGRAPDPDEDTAFVVKVTKTGITNRDLGTATSILRVSKAWLVSAQGQGKRIVITKIADDGRIFSGVAECGPNSEDSEDGDAITCSASFEREAGGFSVFALHAIAPIVAPTPTPFPPVTVVPEEEIVAADPEGGVVKVVHPTGPSVVALPDDGTSLRIPGPVHQTTVQLRLRVLAAASLAVQPDGQALRIVQVDLFDSNGQPIEGVRFWLRAKLSITMTDAEIQGMGGLGHVFSEHALGRLGLRRYSASATGGYWTRLHTSFDTNEHAFSAQINQSSIYARVWATEPSPYEALAVTAPPAGPIPVFDLSALLESLTPSPNVAPTAAVPATGDIPVFNRIAFALGVLGLVLLLGGIFLVSTGLRISDEAPSGKWSPEATATQANDSARSGNGVLRLWVVKPLRDDPTRPRVVLRPITPAPLKPESTEGHRWTA